jgi:hypothetical protein
VIDISLFQVPYHAGDDRHESSEGPRRLVGACAADYCRRKDTASLVSLQTAADRSATSPASRLR